MVPGSCKFDLNFSNVALRLVLCVNFPILLSSLASLSFEAGFNFCTSSFFSPSCWCCDSLISQNLFLPHCPSRLLTFGQSFLALRRDDVPFPPRQLKPQQRHFQIDPQVFSPTEKKWRLVFYQSLSYSRGLFCPPVPRHRLRFPFGAPFFFFYDKGFIWRFPHPPSSPPSLQRLFSHGFA